MKKIKFVIPIILGLISGFLLLHPISMIIVDLFERARFSIPVFAERVQGGSFIPMGLYFSLLGGTIGLLFSLNSYRLNNTNAELLAIINSIKDRNTNLRERTGLQSPKITSVVREMRPALNKIQRLVEMLTQGNAGTINMRQSTLLSITKGNIDNLFYVIDYLLSMLERQTAVANDKGIVPQESQEVLGIK